MLFVWFGLLGTVYANQQRIIDWWKLRGYTAPNVVAALATDNTMTDYARHLFYVNKPSIASGSAFTHQCPKGGEKTVILGCYIGGDNGIWLYDVTDTRLNGVEEVTAAHEMLHAAYGRLSTSERQQVNAWLQDYAANGLTDQRVKDTIAAYRLTEPDQIDNEMHSIFATEVAALPAPLENYYRRYFTDRAKVTAYTARYQGEFTSRSNQVAVYDAQMTKLKETIDANQASIQSQGKALEATRAEMDALRRSNVTAYNASVAGYNQAVDAYNALLAQTKDAIAEYNDIVDKRNAVALEEQQLAQALSADSVPAQQ